MIPDNRFGRAQRQRGVALLTAILVVAVGTILATNLLWISTLDQRRTSSSLSTDQAIQYAFGAEAWVGDILKQDLEDSPDSDHRGEIWAAEIEPLPIEGGFIVGRVYDMQARFNLNSLVNFQGEENEVLVGQFERLLESLSLDPNLVGAIIDWIDSDSEPRFPYGGEDETYARADPQYRTANVMITSPSELLAINGFTPEIYRALSGYVTALPPGSRLNVNTAGPYLLASLSDEITLTMAQSMVEERGDGPFASVQETFEGLVSEEMLPLIDGVSDHFQLQGQVTIGDTQLTISSVLQRNSSGVTRTLFRSYGDYSQSWTETSDEEE